MDLLRGSTGTNPQFVQITQQFKAKTLYMWTHYIDCDIKLTDGISTVVKR